MQGQCGADVDAGGDGVVAALAAVDVIVRVDGLAALAAGEGGEHFVGVHVGTGAGAGLKHIDRKVLHVITGFQQLIDGMADGLGHWCGQLVQFGVGTGSGTLGQQQGANKALGHRLAADRKVVDGALGLGGIEGVARYLQLAHAVSFNAAGAHLRYSLIG